MLRAPGHLSWRIVWLLLCATWPRVEPASLDPKAVYWHCGLRITWVAQSTLTEPLGISSRTVSSLAALAGGRRSRAGGHSSSPHRRTHAALLHKHLLICLSRECWISGCQPRQYSCRVCAVCGSISSRSPQQHTHRTFNHQNNSCVSPLRCEANGAAARWVLWRERQAAALHHRCSALSAMVVQAAAGGTTMGQQHPSMHGTRRHGSGGS